MAELMRKDIKRTIKEMVLYGIWGMITTCINLLIFYIFIALNMQYIVANVVSYFIAVIISYYFNRKFVFKDENKSNEGAKIVKYFLVRVMSIAIDSFLLWFAVDILLINVYISKIIVSAVVILGTYIFNKLWVFKGKE